MRVSRRPSRVRLELPAPGKPFFTLRCRRQDRDARPAARRARAAGSAAGRYARSARRRVPSVPTTLRTIVAGCGLTAGDGDTRARLRSVAGSALYSDRATTWLQQVAGQWQLAAGHVRARRVRRAPRGSLHRFCRRQADDDPPAHAGRLHARRRAAANTDLTIRLSQVEVNEPIDPAAFAVDVPADATPITLEELRQAGPLGG